MSNALQRDAEGHRYCNQCGTKTTARGLPFLSDQALLGHLRQCSAKAASVPAPTDAPNSLVKATMSIGNLLEEITGLQKQLADRQAELATRAHQIASFHADLISFLRRHDEVNSTRLESLGGIPDGTPIPALNEWMLGKRD